MASPEPSVSPAPEPGAVSAEAEVALFESDQVAGSNGGSSRGVEDRATPIVPIRRDAHFSERVADFEDGPHTTELEFDDLTVDEPVAGEPYDHTDARIGTADFDGEAGSDHAAFVGDLEGDDGEAAYLDEEYVDLSDKRATRGKLKARKVRRVIRYVSPWSVLKVSLLFYACLWIVVTIASVILWRVAVETGGITNVEKFVARLFGEKSFTIDGREIFRASTIAGVILVFAGTGFTVLLSLLFNVICDITGGIRFTVLELESTKRRRRRKG